jgi:hypothetical protein
MFLLLREGLPSRCITVRMDGPAVTACYTRPYWILSTTRRRMMAVMPWRCAPRFLLTSLYPPRSVLRNHHANGQYLPFLSSVSFSYYFQTCCFRITEANPSEPTCQQLILAIFPSCSIFILFLSFFVNSVQLLSLSCRARYLICFCWREHDE